MDKRFDIYTMTEEERQNPNLIKNKKEFQQTPVSIYYGSPKKELVDVCLTCKHILNCTERYQVKIDNMRLKQALNDKEIIEKLSEQEIEKVKKNVYIVVNCINKEVD